jgi:hypothetical protein
MGVVFKGGTSGNRENALPQVPNSGYSQPILDTDTSGAIPGTINFPYCRPTRAGVQEQTADFMPTGFEEAGGTDIEDNTATTGGNEAVFKGAPNTGTKGGPA